MLDAISELASVGLSDEDARARVIAVLVGSNTANAKRDAHRRELDFLDVPKC